MQNKIVKLQIYDLSLFIGESYIFIDGAQFYLIVYRLYHNLKPLGNSEKAISCKFKGFSTETLTLLLPLLTIISIHQLKWYEDSHVCLIFKGS